MSIDFPLHRRWSPFGVIVEPKILVEVRTIRGYRGSYFLVDTGADISIASRRLSERLGHVWDRLPMVTVTGVAPGRLQTRLGSLPLRIGGVDLSVRCLFLDQPDAPYVLGCTDVLDRFALTIDAGRGRISFTEIE